MESDFATLVKLLNFLVNKSKFALANLFKSIALKADDDPKAKYFFRALNYKEGRSLQPINLLPTDIWQYVKSFFPINEE